MPEHRKIPVTDRGPVRGEVYVAAAAALWALIGVYTRELGGLGMPAEGVGAWRALVGGACFVGHVVVRRHRDRVAGRPDTVGASSAAGSLRDHWLGLAAFCGVGVVVFYAALPLAVETGGISLAYVLLYTAPIWVTLGAVAFMGERADRAQVVAVAVTVAGIAALAGSAGGTITVSVVSVSWGLVAGLSYASYYLFGRRLFEALGPPLVFAAALPVGGVVLLLVAGAAPPSLAMVPWLLLLGVGSTYVPYLLFGIGVTRIPSSRAVVVAMVEPVLAAAIGVTFYGERLGPLGVTGGAVVVVAASVVAVRGSR